MVYNSAAVAEQAARRAVATRYDKRDDNYLAFIKFASLRIWLRFNESVTWSDTTQAANKFAPLGAGSLLGIGLKDGCGYIDGLRFEGVPDR